MFRLRLCLVAVLLTTACGGEGGLGPPDSFRILRATEPPSATGAPPALRPVSLDDPAAQPLFKLFGDGFASEMLRTVYLVKQLVRDGQPGGKPAPAAGRAIASTGLPVVLGFDRDPYDRGLALERWLREPARFADTPWLGLPADLERDRALVQTVSGRLATLALHLAVTGGTASDPTPVLPRALGDGYRTAMEVIAREWRTGSGPQGVVAYDAGTAAQRARFADVRENRFVVGPDGHTVRPAAELLADPGVTATVIYRLAQSRAVAGRLAPPAFYQTFAAGRFPPGVSPAAVLGPFRNFQAKLLGCWADAALRGQAPRDLVDLIQTYASAFPDEKTEVLRIFVVTTFAATLEPGGLSTRPQDASKTLATIDALVADLVAGKRPLRGPVR